MNRGIAFSIMAIGVVVFLIGTAYPTLSLSGTGNCAPNTAGLCITAQTPNPSQVGQAVTFTGTAPTPPSGSVWTLYCNANPGPSGWSICGSTTSTGSWTISLTFPNAGTITVSIALNNAGIAGSAVTASQTVGAGGSSTTTTVTTSSTVTSTTTITTTIGGYTTTMTSTMTTFITTTYSSGGGSFGLSILQIVGIAIVAVGGFVYATGGKRR